MRCNCDLQRAAADLLAAGPEPHAARTRRARRRADREGARARNAAQRRRPLAAAHQLRQRWRRISASSPPARATRCATWARNSPPATPCPRSATTSRATRTAIDIQFLPRLEGYIWVFPRCGHLSVGICGKGEPARCAAPAAGALHEREGHRAGRARPSTATCCPRSTPTRGAATAWRATAGWRWATPPGWWIPSPARASITRSAPATWPRARCSPTSAAWRKSSSTTAALLRHDFAGDLEFGSRLAKRFFLGRFLFGAVPARMVQFTRRSPRFAAIMQDLFAGTQPYQGLKTPPAAQPERHALRDRHEPRVEPHGARSKI